MKKLRQSNQQSLFPNLGFGLGLRPEHYSEVSKGRHSSAWFEVVTENYMGKGGRPLYFLEKIRSNQPIVMHGVSLSIGSTDPLNKDYLAQLKCLVERFEPAMVSDHVCWTGVNGQNLHDLLPLPYTRAAVTHVVERVKRVQDVLKRRILLENVSSYLTFEHSEMEEWDFLTEITTGADCGLLLDINNIYVSAVNHGYDPEKFLDGIPAHRVGQFHLAGHSVADLAKTDAKTDANADTTANERLKNARFLIDTHDAPVCDEVWALYASALHRFDTGVSTMIERDANIPELSVLEAELAKARAVAESHYENSPPKLRHDVPARRPAAHGRSSGTCLPLSID